MKHEHAMLVVHIVLMAVSCICVVMFAMTLNPIFPLINLLVVYKADMGVAIYQEKYPLAKDHQQLITHALFRFY